MKKILIIIFTVLSIQPHLLISFASDYNLNHDPQSYVLQKFESNTIVFLGTKHKQPPILKFITDLIPKFHDSGITHICLEIESDQ